MAMNVDRIIIGNPTFKKSVKVKLYPCCCAIPATTTFAEAPINVPLPPRHAPKARAQTKGKMFIILPNSMTTGIIAVVNGILSIKLDANAEIHKIKIILTNNR